MARLPSCCGTNPTTSPAPSSAWLTHSLGSVTVKLDPPVSWIFRRSMGSPERGLRGAWSSRGMGLSHGDSGELYRNMVKAAPRPPSPREGPNHEERHEAHDGGRGDREEPRAHDAAAHAPAHRARALGGADAHDAAADGVRRGDGDARLRHAHEDDAASCLGREALDGRQVRDARGHGADDAPAPEERAQAHGGGAGEDDPGGDAELLRAHG